MDGGTRVAKVLQAHGVPFLFTLCGGHISPILAGCKSHGIRVIDVRDEKNAVFAADAVARLSGVPGVAAVTAGPGVSNALTALKNAQMAQSPIVLLGGATATMLRGRGSLQDIDQMAMIAPHVKWAARPNTLRQVVPALQKALEVCQDGVPGPVFVELAVDLLYDPSLVREWYAAKTDAPARNLKDRVVKSYVKLHLRNQFGLASKPSFAPGRIPHIPQHKPKQLQQATALLARAQRPLLVLGSQAMLNQGEVTRLARAVESLQIPVFLSGMARGLLGANHPLQLRHKRSKALKQADVVLLAGVPCDFRLDYGGHIGRAELITVNRSSTELTKNCSPALAVHADPHRFLCDLADHSERSARPQWLHSLRQRDDARHDEIATLARAPISPINPLQVCQSIERQLSDDSILVVDGGDFVATASYIVSPRGPLSWLDPGVFGTLGVGAGFALGAKLVRPEADVWLLYGDGSAGFSLHEFDSFVRHGLGVVAVIGNDAGWTQIARDQIEILGDDVGTVLRPTDYHKVAAGWGGQGILLDDPSKIDSAIGRALKASRKGKPVCVNARVGKTDFRKGSLSM